MGKTNNTLSRLVKVFGILLIIILIVAILQWVGPQQADHIAATSGTATIMPTKTFTPTSTPTVLSLSTERATAPSQPSQGATPSEAPAVTRISRASTPPRYTYEVVNRYPHDPQAFTQGLIFVDGVLYEGTGRYAQSTLRSVELATGNVITMTRLPAQFFGEGITLFGDKIIQLTWKAGTAFVYDRETFALVKTFTYPTEGWGITHDGKQLIMSDGSATLYFRDPGTFEEIGRVEVFDDNGPVILLNELEYINGEIFANVWKTDRIARIDPETGQVIGWISLAGLLAPEALANPADMQNGIAVLNGIAYDAATERLFVTGKLWPALFEINVMPVKK